MLVDNRGESHRNWLFGSFFSQRLHYKGMRSIPAFPNIFVPCWNRYAAQEEPLFNIPHMESHRNSSALHVDGILRERCQKKKKPLGRLQTLFQDLLVPPEMLLLNQLILVMSKTRWQKDRWERWHWCSLWVFSLHQGCHVFPIFITAPPLSGFLLIHSPTLN